MLKLSGMHSGSWLSGGLSIPHATTLSLMHSTLSGAVLFRGGHDLDYAPPLEAARTPPGHHPDAARRPPQRPAPCAEIGRGYVPRSVDMALMGLFRFEGVAGGVFWSAVGCLL